MQQRDHPPCRSAFTLVEILVSTVIVGLLLVLLLSATSHTSTIWRKTTGKVEQFRQAREAFDAMSRRLSHATLNTYWDYDDPVSPTRYIRQSELRFLSAPMTDLPVSPPAGKTWISHGVFFQAPLGAAEPGNTTLSGLNNLLNTWGYFVEFGSDQDMRPGVLGTTVQPRWRYRLCELIQPASALTIYDYTSGTDSSGKPRNLSYTGIDWFKGALTQSDSSRPVRSLAENVIALIVTPSLSLQDREKQLTADKSANLAPGYRYDSTGKDMSTVSDPVLNPKHQLPPLVQVTMVALDEGSVRQQESGDTMLDYGVDDLFKNPESLEDNLKTLEETLIGKRLSYRTFTTNVQIKEAKWSKEQKN